MAFYKMQEVPDIRKDGTKTTYPRITGGRVISTNELAARMCEESTFNPGEVKGIIASMCKHMAWEMRDGNRVKIEGLGTFSISLGLVEHAEPEVPGGNTKRNAQSLRARGVNYRPEKEFISNLNTGLRLERSPYKPGKSSTCYTPEERLARAVEYLDTHPFITVRDYRRLTGLCTTPAREELRRWARTPGTGIGSDGMASHRVYVKKAIGE